eukprot:6622585-Prymnesium_polylepis.1
MKLLRRQSRVPRRMVPAPCRCGAHRALERAKIIGGPHVWLCVCLMGPDQDPRDVKRVTEHALQAKLQREDEVKAASWKKKLRRDLCIADDPAKVVKELFECYGVRLVAGGLAAHSRES